MTSIASLGSINIDFVRQVTDDERRRLADEHEWLPPAATTVRLFEQPALPRGSFQSFLGGKGANQAVAAAKAGAETTLLGAVGPDQADFGVLDSLRRRGVVVDDVERADVPTGGAYIFVETDGTNRIAIVEGANGTVDETYVSRMYDRIADVDCLLLQNEIPISTMRTLLDRLAEEASPPTVLYNPSPVDGARKLLTLDAINVVSVNEVEYRTLRDELASFDGLVVETRGSKPVRVRGRETFDVAPPAVSPVDTTGAGDTFNGYLATGLASGESIRSNVERAVDAAALSTERCGAQRSIPPLEDVRRFGRE